MSFEAKLTSRVEVIPGSLYTAVFTAPSPIEGVQRHYEDLRMIACHFLIQSDQGEKKRHYTVCNVMRKEVYADYMKVIDS